MQFCGANESAQRLRTKRCHSPLDHAPGSVTVASRDPASRFSRDDCCIGGTSRGLRPRPNERRKEKEGARRNARGCFADAIGNAETERDPEAGKAKIEIEKESDADPNA